VSLPNVLFKNVLFKSTNRLAVQSTPPTKENKIVTGTPRRINKTVVKIYLKTVNR